jgi:hypothetical protein
MAWMLANLWRVRSRRVAILAIVASVGLFLLLRPRPQFGPNQFELLHEGMTLSEVVTVLGYPPGDYRPAIWSQPDWFVSPSDIIGLPLVERGQPLRELDKLERQDFSDWIDAGRPEPEPPLRSCNMCWWGQQYGIVVGIDPNGHVIYYSLLEMLRPRPPHNAWLWLRWWIGV